MEPTITKKSEHIRHEEVRDYFYAVYFYYFPQDGGVRIYEWWDPDPNNPISDPVERIKILTINADKDGNYPPYYTDNPCYMMMRREKLRRICRQRR